MTKPTSEADLSDDIRELKHMLMKWDGDTCPETILGRQLVRQAIARQQAKLRELYGTRETEGGRP